MSWFFKFIVAFITCLIDNSVVYCSTSKYALGTFDLPFVHRIVSLLPGNCEIFVISNYYVNSESMNVFSTPIIQYAHTRFRRLRNIPEPLLFLVKKTVNCRIVILNLKVEDGRNYKSDAAHWFKLHFQPVEQALDRPPSSNWPWFFFRLFTIGCPPFVISILPTSFYHLPRVMPIIKLKLRKAALRAFLSDEMYLFRSESFTYPFSEYDSIVFITLPEDEHSDFTKVCAVQVKHRQMVHCETINPKNVSLHSLKQTLKNAKRWQVFYFSDTLVNTIVQDDSYPLNSRNNLDMLTLTPEIILTLIAMKVCNITQHWNRGVGTRFAEYGHPNIETFIYSNSPTELTYTEDVIFITCHTYQPYIDFRIYITPFSLGVWIAIGISLVVLACALFAYGKLKGCPLETTSCFLYFVSFLAEEPAFIPSKIENQYTFNIFNYPWTLLAVILTTSYSGCLINQLNSPLAGDKVQTINEILETTNQNYRKDQYVDNNQFWCSNHMIQFRSSITDVVLKKFANYTNYDKSSRFFTLLSHMTEACDGVESLPYLQFLRGYDTFFDMIWNENKHVNSYIDSSHRYHPPVDKSLSLLLKIDKYLGPHVTKNWRTFMESTIEMELTTCDKVAFSGRRSVVLYEMDYLNANYKNTNPFYSLPDQPLYVKYEGIVYGRAFKHGEFETSLHRVLQTGIHVIVRKYRDQLRYFRRRIGTKLIETSSPKFTVARLKITGAIQTLFYITCIFLLKSVVLLTLEMKVHLKLIDSVTKMFFTFRLIFNLVGFDYKLVKFLNRCSKNVLTTLLTVLKPRKSIRTRYRTSFIN